VVQTRERIKQFAQPAAENLARLQAAGR